MQPARDTFVAAFEAANIALAGETSAVMARIVRSPPLHARFINTLSMLEHIGSHKIMATQSGAAIDQPTLKHLAEETRHAFFFKRHAEAAAGRPLHYTADDLLVPVTARMYFQRLEAAMVRAFGRADSGAIYLHMSMIVEFRAVWAYRLYQAVLDAAHQKMSLKSLMAEEQAHLVDMTDRLAAMGELDADRIGDFCKVEKRLYEKLLGGLKVAITNTSPLEGEVGREPARAAGWGAAQPLAG